MNMNSPCVLRARLLLIAVAMAAVTPHAANADTRTAPRLSFDVEEGLNLNSFLREGPVAAHLVLRSGSDARLLVAFPAGNSGIALWFAHTAAPVTWKLAGRPQPLTGTDTKGRPLYGMTAEASVTGASDLIIKQVLLSSVRVLRDFPVLGTFPAQIAAQPTVQNATITWARDRLDGAPGYRLSVEVTHGVLKGDHLTAGIDGSIGLKITAMSGETPMTPLPSESLLNAQAQTDATARNVLTFLSYQEKFTAGSWRFNTYFGRDTLMSVRLLMPVLTPDAIQAGLGSVFTRLSPQGEVAHEEDIGEFAILDHVRAKGTPSDDPVFDYKMIDGSFMLAPVAEQWLLNDARARTQAAAFLARKDARQGEPPRAFGADLVSNLKFVLQAAAKFADDPQPANLVALKPGIDVGQWRDSQDGLAGGRVPYDVNAVFVPAAVTAAGRFYRSGLLNPYLSAADRGVFARAETIAQVWRTKAAPLFEVLIANASARRSISDYAAALNVPAAGAIASIGHTPVRFHALSLDAQGRALPILNSDEGFELLFGEPSPEALRRALISVMRPFPAGLLTDVGVLVANPAYASADVQSRLTRNAYHGTVIWSWQQAVLAAGLRRQLARAGLPADTKQLLRKTQTQLWAVIRSAQALRNSELWSWTFSKGRFEIAPFGASTFDADESNAAQLWSTVYLAIPNPDVPRPPRPSHDAPE